MNYKVVDIDQFKYIELSSTETPISSEKDILEVVAICFENNCNFIMLEADTLSDDFYRLRTGLAGIILQKFINYRIKVAVILENNDKVKGKFKELLSESNKGSDFRTFFSITEATDWFSSFIS